MANAMKKPVKHQAAPATEARTAPGTPADKVGATAPEAVSRAATAHSASKSSPAKRASTPRPETATAKPGKASRQVEKSSSKAAIEPASAQLKAPVTTKKTESKAAGKTAKLAAPVETRQETSVSPAMGTVSQTTDAATLAAIDTSGYVLPGVKVPGRRGRKPKDFQPENEEVAALNAVERAELKAADKAKARDRKAKEKALLKDAFSSDTEASEEELERRRQKLKTLIKLGKERGFLTYSEINDHLPENIVDPEAIEGIIGTFNDMGIAVYEHAPDAEQLLLSDSVASAASDDDAEAAAEAALSTVDSDFGRTTDPVRMYMREMGSVELLTREGEIEIAKRIEDGLKDMIQAISACPTTISEILAAADRISKDEIKIDEMVDGLVDDNQTEAAPAPAVVAAEAEDEDEEEGDEEEGEEEEEAGTAAGAAGFSAEQLEQLKRDALGKFGVIAEQFDNMRKAFEKEGYNSKAYVRAQEAISNELLGIRFTAKVCSRPTGRAWGRSWPPSMRPPAACHRPVP